MSALGQKRTHAAQQKRSLIDHLVCSAQEKRSLRGQHGGRLGQQVHPPWITGWPSHNREAAVALEANAMPHRGTLLIRKSPVAWFCALKCALAILFMLLPAFARDNGQWENVDPVISG
jgi:hypothetical protein